MKYLIGACGIIFAFNLYAAGQTKMVSNCPFCTLWCKNNFDEAVDSCSKSISGQSSSTDENSMSGSVSDLTYSCTCGGALPPEPNNKAKLKAGKQ